MKTQGFVTLVALALAGGCAAAQAADSDIERGKYLVTLGG
jgi:hypothetical protein